MPSIKNLAVPSEHIDRVLSNDMMLDGSSIKGFRNIETSDMFFYPDKNTFQILPWQERDGRKSARLICDIYNADGRIVDFGILKNVDNSLLYFTKNPYTSNFSLEDIEIVATIKVPKNKTNLVIEETRDFMQDATANDPEYVLYTKKITDL